MPNRTSASQKRNRLLTACAIALGLAGLWAWAHVAMQNEHEAVHAARAERLDTLGQLMQKVFLAEEAKLDSLLVRVRSDLREDANWARQEGEEPIPAEGAGTSVAPADPEIAVTLSESVQAERWRSVRADLKRGLSARPDLMALEVVVADQAGLSAVRVARSEAGLVEEFEDPRSQTGVAKAIWYSDEVRRAVAANGRSVARGGLSEVGSGKSSATQMRVALALHDPSELVQGVLVATLDIAAIVDALVALAGQDITSRIVTADGRLLRTARAPDGSGTLAAASVDAQRDASLAARIVAAEGREGAFEADQRLVLGVLLRQGDGQISEAVVLLETALPAAALATWAGTAWGIGLMALTLLAAVGLVLLLRRGDAPSPAAEQEEVAAHAASPRLDAESQVEAEVGASDAATAELGDADEAVVLDPEPIVLRDWLADVRGCLEREAATRGLSLNLRCERSLPRYIEQDPGWLGGLLLAMGQEALDATTEERVIIRIREDAHEVMRFEVDAGAIDLSPVRGMIAVADRMGGRFEADRKGCLAFVLPLATDSVQVAAS